MLAAKTRTTADATRGQGLPRSRGSLPPSSRREQGFDIPDSGTRTVSCLTQGVAEVVLRRRQSHGQGQPAAPVPWRVRRAAGDRVLHSCWPSASDLLVPDFTAARACRSQACSRQPYFLYLASNILASCRTDEAYLTALCSPTH